MISIFINWGFGVLINRFRSDNFRVKLIMITMLLINFGILFIFKFMMFAIKNINTLFGAGVSIPSITLPIGISFFTFHAVSYVVDVYRNSGEVQKNPLNVCLYIAFFPSLIAGPIVRYQNISDQIYNRTENLDDFSKGVCRFILGLSKKVLIANSMALVADKAFGIKTNELSVSFAWLGAIAYTFQIYFDFSGYSDMAIGLGKMFGFHLDENFNYPYISRSISDFWRRWHISLGSWFRYYVYYPLGGSRVDSKLRLVFNLFVVWFSTGVWHGANWTFIVWGVFYFVFITAEKLVDFDKHFNRYRFLKNVYTLLLVVFGWVLFRANNITQALEYLKAMLGLAGRHLFDDNFTISLFENIYIFFFAAIFSMPAVNWIANKFKLQERRTYAVIYSIAALMLLVLSISYMIKGVYNPFIYFNF
jgi:alginate O-acetyltransferase complex protein AlgI